MGIEPGGPGPGQEGLGLASPQAGGVSRRQVAPGPRGRPELLAAVPHRARSSVVVRGVMETVKSKPSRPYNHTCFL